VAEPFGYQISKSVGCDGNNHV